MLEEVSRTQTTDDGQGNELAPRHVPLRDRRGLAAAPTRRKWAPVRACYKRKKANSYDGLDMCLTDQ